MTTTHGVPRFRDRALAVARIGVGPDTQRGPAKRITVTNAYCITVIALMQPYIAVFALAGAAPLAALIPPLSIAQAIPLWLNHRRRYASARVVMLWVSVAAVLVYSVALGFGSGVHLFFLPLACCPIVVFGSAERVPRYVCVALAAVAGVFAIVWSWNRAPAYPLADGVTLSLYVACTVSALLLLMTTLEYFSYAQERAEQELAEAHQSIEAELGQRYQRAVDERRRIDAQLRFADRLASVGTLAAGVAHEINNPLTYVSLNLELIKRAAASGNLAAIERAAAKSADGVGRVAVIVRDLMTFSRGDEDTRAAVDVCKVLDAALGIAHGKLKHGGEVVRNYGQPMMVWANEARLGQVFLNLLLNANQAVAAGADSGRIQISVDGVPGSGRARIEIADNGAGIPPDVMPQIFDPFYTTKPVGLGTGLGRYITRRIVEDMAGTIEVDSEVGSGTTFRVELPTPASDGTRPATDVGRRASSSPLRVLVVDDEPDVLQVLQALLDEHDTVAVGSGADAVAVIRDDSGFDMVLCDVMMSPMSGQQLYEHVEAEYPALAERFVFMTGGAPTREAARFVARVPRTVLHKPLDLDELALAIADAAGRDVATSPPASRDGR